MRKAALRALWVYPCAYGTSQVVTGVQCGIAAQLLVIFGGFGMAEALAVVLPLGYPVALAQIALFSWLFNAWAGSPRPAAAGTAATVLSRSVETASSALRLDAGLDPAFATASVAPIRRR